MATKIRVKVLMDGRDISQFTPPERGLITKRDEKEILAELRKIFNGKQMYLSSLFTEKLYDWAATRISDDFPPDIMAELKHVDGLRAQFDSGLNKAGQEIKRLNETINILNQKVDQYREIVEAKEKRIAELVDEEGDHIRVLKDRLADHEKRNSALEKDLQKANLAIPVLENEILRLKAKMFDLLNKE